MECAVYNILDGVALKCWLTLFVSKIGRFNQKFMLAKLCNKDGQLDYILAVHPYFIHNLFLSTVEKSDQFNWPLF